MNIETVGQWRLPCQQRILRYRFPGTHETVGQVFKFARRLCWKINVVCMWLSPFISFQSLFVTYLLTLPRNVAFTLTGMYLSFCFTVAVSVVCDDISAVLSAACGFTGNPVYVNGAMPYVLTASIPKSHSDLYSWPVLPSVSQHRFQNGEWWHIVVLWLTARDKHINFLQR
jgi:hypothetical protein